MGYKPRQLGHINIFVRNAERARDWYEDLLGLHTYGFMPGRAAFMTSGLGNSHEIALNQAGDDAPGPQRGQVGLKHADSPLPPSTYRRLYRHGKPRWKGQPGVQ